LIENIHTHHRARDSAENKTASSIHPWKKKITPYQSSNDPHNDKGGEGSTNVTVNMVSFLISNIVQKVDHRNTTMRWALVSPLTVCTKLPEAIVPVTVAAKNA